MALVLNSCPTYGTSKIPPHFIWDAMTKTLGKGCRVQENSDWVKSKPQFLLNTETSL